MTTYERVRADGKTLYLRDPVETSFLGAPALTGVQVDREGNEVAPRGVDELRHIIDLGAVTKRTPVTMDRTYAVLLAEGETA